MDFEDRLRIGTLVRRSDHLGRTPTMLSVGYFARLVWARCVAHSHQWEFDISSHRPAGAPLSSASIEGPSEMLRTDANGVAVLGFAPYNSSGVKITMPGFRQIRYDAIDFPFFFPSVIISRLQVGSVAAGSVQIQPRTWRGIPEIVVALYSCMLLSVGVKVFRLPSKQIA